MKTYFNFLIAVIFISILAIGCSKNKNHSDCITQDCQTIVAEPTPYEIADKIVFLAGESFRVKGIKLYNPIISIKVNQLLDSIFPNDSTTDYENYGMRIYPALTTLNQKSVLAYIICTSTNYDSDKENNYHLIDATNVLKCIDSSTANNLNLNFLNNVYLEDKKYKIEDHNYITSRYYDWLGLKSYLTANNYNYNSTEQNFELQFSFGYVDSTLAQQLYNLYWNRAADKPEDLKGFTVVLELLNNKISVVNRNACGTTNFKGGILEIGNPCPPRCKGEGLANNI